MRNRILIVTGMVVLFIITRYFDLNDAITVDKLIENKDRLIAFTDEHYLTSVLVFILGYVLLVTIGLPVFSVFSLAAGLIFGFLDGLIFCVTSATIGGYFTFIASKTIFYDVFRKRYAKRLNRIESKFNEKSFRYLLSMRLIPGVPYSLTNVLSGLTTLDWKTFGLATVLGILPGTSIFIYVGYNLREVDEFDAFKRPEFITAIVLLGIIMFVAIIFRLKKNKAI